MKNDHLWQPTKYVSTAGNLAASPDTAQVSLRSRIVTDLVASAYEEALRKHASGALIDVGCGKVPLYGVYRDLVDQVVCVDWANTSHPSPYLDYELDLNKPLPFPDEQFDTILATDVLEHLKKPDLFWSEAARLLRPGGKVILGVPFLYWIHEDPHDHYRYTRYRLAVFCEEHGLEVVSLEAYGGPLAVIADLVGKNVPGQLPARTFQSLARAFIRSRLGQRMDRARRDRFPLGYCLVAQKPDR
jgi:SAM-dependent methyltransferase